MDYRREIDGLRALAVLSVVTYHTQLDLLPGGFVGVDIFFVISGYLITSIILSERQAGAFSLIRFYERRARRILPALFVVLIVSFVIGWMVLWPTDFKAFAKSMIHVAIFTSNFHFYREIGYFEPDVELSPLLHTWSLAVEEQYYIFFPLIIMAAWRLGKARLFGAVFLLALASLAYAEFLLRRSPESAFYLLPTRAWELFGGAMLAFYLGSGSRLAIRDNRAVGNVMGALGIGLIAYATLMYDKYTPFPGLHALLPTVGACLIILFATPDTVIGRLLGNRFLVVIGLCSYSIYLWHQPLFAFANHATADAPSPYLMVALAAGAITLAYPTWKFVETPFRNRSMVSGRTILIAATSGTLFFFLAGLIGKNSAVYEWLANRSDSQHSKMLIESRLDRNHGLGSNCGEPVLSDKCRTGADPEVLIWGDSYAMHLVAGFIASNPNRPFIQQTRSNCGPMFGIAALKPEDDIEKANDCLKFNEYVGALLDSHKSIKYAALSSPFSQYVESNHRIFLKDDPNPRPPSMELLSDHLFATLRNLRSRGIEPTLFAPPPANGRDLGKCLAMAEFNKESLERCNFPPSEIVATRLEIFNLLRTIEKEFKVVWLHEEICGSRICAPYSGSTFYFRDAGHLSKEGSELLGIRLNFFGALRPG